MKWSKITLATLVMLVILAALAVTNTLMNRKGTFGRRNTAFAVPAGTDITMIEMRQQDKRIVLRKEREGWSVNRKEEVRNSAVSFLVQTLNEIAIKSPVSPDLYEREVAKAGVVPVRVKVFSGKKVAASFLVYKTGSNIYGNIMKKSELGKPFIMSVPGFEGSIGSNFNMNELFWLPFTVFNLFPSEIASVEVIYTGRPEESFRVINPSLWGGIMAGGERDVLQSGGDVLPGGITVAGGKVKPGGGDVLPGGITTIGPQDVLPERGRGLPDGEVDSLMVRRYLSYFTMVRFETWAFDMSRDESDSLLSSPPTVVIDVTKVDGSSEQLRIWERYLPGDDGTLRTDTDRAWGAKGKSGDIFIVRYFDIDPLLRKRSYFYRAG